ncbi:MAG: hypothetical protein M5U14_18325 [Acidimicrobiia bacterium]|nr:hypothetical protein [Acidimicrobiia bacterium]
MGAYPLTNTSLDADRTHELGSWRDALRRRIEGRYPIDPFGADLQLQDALWPLVGPVVRLEVDHAERLPEVGAAVLLANRGLGVGEPLALGVAVRKVVRRRLRVVGAPDLPLARELFHRLGAVGSRHEDLGAVLRAGHLAAVPLGPTWLRTGAGEPPLPLLVAALGFPVIPVAVRPGGPLGLPLRPWRVTVGRPIEQLPGVGRGDTLAAAELAERARVAVEGMLAAG